MLYRFFQSLSTEVLLYGHCWDTASYLCGKIRRKSFGSSESFHKKRFPVRILMLDGYEVENIFKIYNYSYSAMASSHYFNSKKPANYVVLNNLMFYIHLGGTSGFPLEAHHPTGWTSGIHRLHQKSLLESLSKPS